MVDRLVPQAHITLHDVDAFVLKCPADQIRDAADRGLLGRDRLDKLLADPINVTPGVRKLVLQSVLDIMDVVLHRFSDSIWVLRYRLQRPIR